VGRELWVAGRGSWVAGRGGGLYQVPGQKEREAHQDQVRKHEDAERGDQVPVASWAVAGLLFELVDDLLVAVLYYKDIMKEHRGKAVDGECEKDRFQPGIEPVMFDKMEIKGFQ